MRFDKRHIAVLALTACAVAISAYLSRRRHQQEKAREHQNALEVWENEGGMVRPSAVQRVEAY